MSARNRNLDCPARDLLPFHVGKIFSAIDSFRNDLPCVCRYRHYLAGSSEKVDRLAKSSYRINVQPFDDGRLASVLHGNEYAALADIAHLDEENRLPLTGYLYIFLHTDGGDYDLEADVRYFESDPELAIDDFNLEVGGYERFNDAYLMEFCKVDDGEACTRLLGVPSDWNYEDKPPKLLLQFDPLDSEMGFLNHLDGFLYFFFGKNGKDFEGVTLVEEYS
jgi:hypothetical protein